MNKKGPWILLVVLLVLAILGMIWAYGFVTNRHQNGLFQKGPSMGYVKMDDVLRLNPSSEDYVQAQKELDLMRAQYSAEQETLNAKATLQQEQLKALSTDPGVTDSLNTEIKAKITAKENEMNAALEAKRQELLAKYMAEIKVSPTDVDLQIVNLQLQLMTYNRRPPYGAEQRAQFEQEKADLESRLQALLAQRGPNISGNAAQVKARVEAELQPAVEAGQKELDDYAASLQKDMSQQRDTDLQEQAKAIMESSDLPNAAEWNQAWEERLDDKQAEVDAIYESMLDDIRMRVAVIAESQGLDVVMGDDGATNVTGLDITEAVVASYGVQ